MDKGLSEALRRRMAARADAFARDMFSGITTTNTAPQGPLTLDTLRRLMCTMPKPEMWLSTRLYPASSDALRIEAGSENFLIAHPSLWLKLRHHCERDMTPPNPLRVPTLAFGIQVVEIDLEGDESPDRRAYLEGIWRRLMDAIKVACVELPEWLRTAPKFTKHG